MASRGSIEWRAKISASRGSKYAMLTDEEILRNYANREYQKIPEVTLYYLMRKRGLNLRRPWGRRIARTLSDIEKAWLACAIDSEGWIGPSSKKRHRIGISNSSRQYIDHVVEITGINHVKIRKAEPHKAELFIWQCEEKKALKSILEQVLPFLIIKGQRAQEAIQAAN